MTYDLGKMSIIQMPEVDKLFLRTFIVMLTIRPKGLLIAWET